MKAVLTYHFGDYGTQPARAPLAMQVSQCELFDDLFKTNKGCKRTLSITEPATSATSAMKQRWHKSCLWSTCRFSLQSLLWNHFMFGSSYPVGGASEIALCIIPTIEKAGGRVLVRAPVVGFCFEGGRVNGVQVQRTGK